MDEQVLRAIVKFTKRVKRDKYAKVYAPLGDGYRRVGLLEDAAQVCRDGLKVFPRYLACREVLGRVFLRQNKLADARRELELVHETIGESLDLRKALAKVYAKSGDRANAEGLLKWVIEKDPFDFEMRNLLMQITRDAEARQRHDEAVARGENPDAVDIFALAEKSSVVDIMSIVGNEEEVDFDAERQQQATDDALDGLEDIESTIDAEADRIAESAQGEKPRKKRRKKKSEDDSARRREMIARSVEEISAAAVIAQIEIEISLLDEAAIVCNRLREREPDDADIVALAEKFAQRLEEKEAELEKLEHVNLAHGL